MLRICGSTWSLRWIRICMYLQQALSIEESYVLDERRACAPAPTHRQTKIHFMRRWTFVIWLCCVCSSVWCEAWPCDWCIARHLTNRIYNIYMCKCTVYYGFTFAVWIFHKHTVHTRNTARWCCAFASGHRCLVHNNLWETDIRCAHNRIRFVSAIESHKEHHRRALNWTTSRCANEIRIAHFRFAGMFEIWKFKSLKVMSKSCRRVLLGKFSSSAADTKKILRKLQRNSPMSICMQSTKLNPHSCAFHYFFSTVLIYAR